LENLFNLKVLSYTANGITLTDDGEGNLLSGSDIVGNVIYPHGLIIFTGNLTDTYLSLIEGYCNKF
jgi:hypothetical protein